LTQSAALRIGTRGSRLALAQAASVAEAIGGGEVVAVSSSDSEPGDKERFVRGVERALLAAEVDMGVHSAKDLPGRRPEDVRLAGVPRREDPRDAYIGNASALAEVPHGARIGTASLRRRSQLLALREDLDVVELRGNVDTRLRKLADGDYDGIVLAAAGLHRLDRASEISFAFDLDALTPSPGQGSLAIEVRRGDDSAAADAARISDHDALVELTAERAAVAVLGASCQTPIGVCARLGADGLAIHGYAGLPDGTEWVRDLVTGDPEQPAALGQALADRMIAAGAREILSRAQEAA
jgi:hydroxymethylbilane synthase